MTLYRALVILSVELAMMQCTVMYSPVNCVHSVTSFDVEVPCRHLRFKARTKFLTQA